jgi:hypothetical protein
MKAEQIAERYIALWNETKPDARLEGLRAGWTEGARYVDPMMQAEGIAEIDGLISAVQERFPGYRFRLTGRPDGHGAHCRFTWALGPEGEKPPIRGFDVVRLQEGRIAEVVGFLDAVPGG